jgi:hypothetical protein
MLCNAFGYKRRLSPPRKPVRAAGRSKADAASVSFPELPWPGPAPGRAFAIGAPSLSAPRGTTTAPDAFPEHQFPRYRAEWRPVRPACPPSGSELRRGRALRTPLAGSLAGGRTVCSRARVEQGAAPRHRGNRSRRAGTPSLRAPRGGRWPLTLPGVDPLSPRASRRPHGPPAFSRRPVETPARVHPAPGRSPRSDAARTGRPVRSGGGRARHPNRDLRLYDRGGKSGGGSNTENLGDPEGVKRGAG